MSGIAEVLGNLGHAVKGATSPTKRMSSGPRENGIAVAIRAANIKTE